MIKKPNWIVFDIGGVIFDYKQAIKKVASHVGKEENKVMEALFEHLEDGELGLITFEEAWEKAFNTLKLNHNPEIAIKLWWQVGHYITDTRLLMSELAKNEYSLALFTNNWIGMMEQNKKDIQEFGLAKYIFESSKIKLRKPDGLFYEYVEKVIGESGQQIFFVDDSAANIQAGIRFGWQTFLYSLGEDNGVTTNNTIRKLLL